MWNQISQKAVELFTRATPLAKRITIMTNIWSGGHTRHTEYEMPSTKVLYLPLSIVNFPTNHSEKSFNVQSTSYGEVGKGLCTQFLSIVTFL